ncbi:hypothetical protein Tco_0428637 [Tanacetum coccineum]
MIDINTTGIALTRTSRLLRPQYCLLCPHAHRFAFVFLAWGFRSPPKPVLLSLKHAQLPVLGSTRMYRDLRLPTSGPK